MSSEDNTIQEVYMRITQKIQDCQKQLGQIDVQISANERESRLASLTKREIEPLDSSTPLYKSVGKMFVQESKETLIKDLDSTIESSKSMVDALQKKQKFVQRDLDEASGNLRDVIRSINPSAAVSKA
ncbi:hypothetical protein J3B02_006035 [Coemansia erecta]|uniref:Prefoldin subunit 1 n=1 Tax=Coemansia asiatica TaxID=1052880 RepID=A0A9W8CHH9_9FUNG|nr:hypothetical protein LPJ64_004217 [Coemansia asiatica]KAJ2841129.1 hypothetical protein J3B02_006035 [Coemansia erecta]